MSVRRDGLGLRRWAVAAVCAAGWSAAAGAQPATRPADAAELARTIARAVADLGSDVWKEREEATKLLWSLGRAAEPALRRALKTDDPEVRIRAQRVLRRFKWGVYPDTPEEIVALIRRYREGDRDTRRAVVAELLERGAAGYRAAMSLGAAVDDEAARQAVFNAVRRRSAELASRLLIEGQDDEVESLLEAAVATGQGRAMRRLAAWHLLRGSLKARIAACRRRPRHDRPLADRLAAYLHRAAGELTEARAAAERAHDDELLESILYEMGDWRALAERNPWKDAAAGDIEQVGFAAAYCRLAGKTAQLESALKHIRTAGGARPKEVYYYAEALLINDRPDDASELLIAAGQFDTAMSLLSARLDFDGALRVARQAWKVGDERAGAARLAAARLLVALGETERARQALGPLLDEPTTRPSRDVRVERIAAEALLGMDKRALDHAAEALERLKPDEPFTPPLRAAFPNAGVDLRAWWEMLRWAHDNETRRRTLDRLKAVIEKGLGRAELAALGEKIADGGPRVEDRCRWLRAIGDVAHEAGLEDLSLELRRRAADLQPSWWLRMNVAGTLGRLGRWAEAAEAYQQAWDRDDRRAGAAYLAGDALMRAGKAAEGRRLMELAVLLPLADDSYRYGLARALQDRGLSAAAGRQWEIIARTGEPGSWEVGEAARTRLYRRALQSEAHFLAADHAERGRLPCLRLSTAMTAASGHLVLGARAHTARARGHLAAGDVDRAAAEARIAAGLLPGDVDLPIALVPELAGAGAVRQAEELFAAVFDRLEAVCRRYPRAASYHNQASWLAARCRRRLERARILARRAVELAPKRSAYLDTLAEVEFQRGRRDEAVRIIRRAIELDPEFEYLARQLERFRTGDPSTDPDEP